MSSTTRTIGTLSRLWLVLSVALLGWNQQALAAPARHRAIAWNTHSAPRSNAPEQTVRPRRSAAARASAATGVPIPGLEAHDVPAGTAARVSDLLVGASARVPQRWDQVLQSAWEAYGHRAEELEQLLGQMDRLVREFRRRWQTPAEEQSGTLIPTARRAFALCRLLHQKWLRRYRLQATDPHQAWTTGHYNCVSGTLLFCVAASRLGWQVRARELPEHVQAAVKTASGRWQAVETTLESGVPPAGKPPAASASPPRPLSPREFLAVVYYNRAIDVAERGRAEQAILWNRRAWMLDRRNANIRNNLVATVNNHALDLARRGQLARAEQLLQQLMRLVPDHPVVQQNLRYVAHQRRQRQRPLPRPIPETSPAAEPSSL